VETDVLKRPTDWFKVHSFKNLEDPSGKIERREIVVSLDQYPYGFGLGPNPRLPNLNSPVSRKIGDTLTDTWQTFHLLNRGVTLVAKKVDYDNKSERVRLVMPDDPSEERLYGILDGGNTNERINKWRDELTADEAKTKLSQSFVNVQILMPAINPAGELGPEMLDLLNDIKEARNTSVQVKSKSLADARRHFDVLKNALSGEPYYGDVSWREGEGGTIDALQIITLLMIFYPGFAAAADGEPSNAYGHKERCLDAFLEYSENQAEELERWISVVPTLVRLFDELQVTLPEYYSGTFGRIEEVKIFDEKRYQKGQKKYRNTPVKSQFLGTAMKYQYPVGWLYPLFAAFRHLVTASKDGHDVVWRRDSIQFCKEHGAELMKRYEPHIREAGCETKKIATSYICYQAMGQAIKDLYKDELLKDAGIDL
jgi:hypothetical protein